MRGRRGAAAARTQARGVRLQLGAAAGAVIAGSYALLPTGPVRDLLYLLVAASPVVAITLGMRRHRPAQTTVWRLLRAGLATTACGDLVTFLYWHVLHRPPLIGPASAFYLTGFLLMILALVVLGRGDRRGRDLGGLLDVAIFSTGLGLVMWMLLVDPGMLAGELALPGRVLGSVYTLCAALLLALLLRLLSAQGPRRRAYWLLLGGAALSVASTATYQALTLVNGGAVSPGSLGVTLADSGLLLAFALFDMAALDPSMRQLSDEVRAGGPAVPPTPWRVVVLGGATLAAPLALAVQLVTGQPLAGWATVVGSTLISLFVLARMVLLLARIHAQADQLATLADTDALTGALNRRAWQRQLHAEAARAMRHRTPLALALIDLDHFKAYNDTHGHPGGDEVLRRAARAWRSVLRAGDVLARLGGDEFAVLLPGATLPAALAAVSHLRLATPAGLTVSVGVVSWAGEQDVGQVTARADAALYEAKRRGRNQVVSVDAALSGAA